MSYTQDLQEAFKNIGVTITASDVDEIIKIGADQFLNLRGLNTTEESMSSIYIILVEMRENISLSIA